MVSEATCNGSEATRSDHASSCSNGHTENLAYDYTKKCNGSHVLVDFVWNYFYEETCIKLGENCVIVTEKARLYFQHDGHSRTIVGIQVKHPMEKVPQYNLLILDPSRRKNDLEKSLKEKTGWQKLIKRGVHTLKETQYQFSCAMLIMELQVWRRWSSSKQLIVSSSNCRRTPKALTIILSDFASRALVPSSKSKIEGFFNKATDKIIYVLHLRNFCNFTFCSCIVVANVFLKRRAKAEDLPAPLGPSRATFNVSFFSQGFGQWS